MGFFPGADKREGGAVLLPQTPVWCLECRGGESPWHSAFCPRGVPETPGQLPGEGKLGELLLFMDGLGVSRYLWKLYQPVRQALALPKHSPSSQPCPEPSSLVLQAVGAGLGSRAGEGSERWMCWGEG